MSFPITVNGRTWTLSQFQNGNYAVNLGPFLYDCLTEFNGRFEATSTTSLSISAASKTFTVQAGKLFKVGQQVRASSTVDPKTFMAGHITSYSGTTLIVAMNTYYGTGTYTSWAISLAGLSLVNATSPLDQASGGSQVATAANLRAWTTFGLPKNSLETIFEDFTGYFPEINSSTLPALFRGFTGHITGAATITNDGNVATIVRDNDRVAGMLDGAHPGIAVLSVYGAGDVAELRYGPPAFSCLHDTDVAQIKFYLPRLSNLTDTVNLSLGLRFWNASDARYAGFAVHYPSAVSTDGAYLGLDVTASGFSEETSNDYALEPGYWYTLKFATIATTSATAELYREDNGIEVLKDTLTINSTPPADSDWALQPFVRLEKLTGSDLRSVLVDYIYWRGSVNR